MGAWSRATVLGLLAVACGSSEKSGEESAEGRDAGGTSGGGAQAASGGAAVAGSANGARGGDSSVGGASARGGTAGKGGTGGAPNAGNDSSGASGSNNDAGASGVGASCPTGATNHTEGSRIRGTYVVTDDGVKKWVNWHDRELDFDCEFFRLNDGLYHCAPNNWDLSDEFFTDADCTDAAYTRGLQQTCTPMNYVFLLDDIDCSKDDVSGYRYYELGDAVSAATPLYRFSGTDCVAATTPSDGVFRKGAEVDYSKFVTATYGPLTTEGRLQGYGMSAADGTRQLTIWFDTELQTKCRLDTAEDGVERCLPDGVSITYYADAACSAPLAQAQNACIDAPSPYLARYPGASCPEGPVKLFASGAAFDGIPHAGSPTSCHEAAGMTAPTFVTTPAPAAMFQAVDSVVNESATTRLKPLLATTPDGGCWFDDLWDSELGAVCRFLTTSDGAKRCVPGTSYPVVRFFDDDACTTPTYYAGPVDCGAAPLAKFVLTGSSTNCGSSVTAFRVAGDPVSSDRLGTKWTSTTVSGCVALTIDAGTYLPLTMMDPAEFVAGKVVTD